MFFRTAPKTETDTDTLIRLLNVCQEQQTFFRSAAQNLLEHVQDFSLDITEIGADVFKADLGGLIRQISSEEKVSRLRTNLEKRKKSIAAYLENLKDYLSKRETEFKEIIEILTHAIAELDSENRLFQDRIFSQSQQIEQITLLDDIKKVKTVLAREVEGLKATVRQKQKQDDQQLKSLSHKVNNLNRELEITRAESMRDGLTGVFNRKSFDGFIFDLVEKNRSARAPFVLFLIDIDNFKSVNDRYGHPVGDRVLLAVAKKCTDGVCNDDFLARYGGEEFALILPGLTLRRAVKRARQICKNIAATRYEIDESPAGSELSVSVSIGVSRFCKADSVKTVISRADKALYAAKQSGKNRVVSEKEINFAR